MEILVLAEASVLSVELVAALERVATSIRTVAKAPEAEHVLATGPYAIVLFDPALAGDDFLRRARRRHPDVPLVARLPRPSTTRAADLFEDGADEVVDGMMGERELVARIRRAATRNPDRSAGRVVAGDLSVDAAHGEACWRGTELTLTPREREVLQVLASAAGRAVRREAIYREVWGYTMARGDRSVDVNVKRLRDKLAGGPGSGIEITTLPGVGYRLDLAGVAEAVIAS